MAENIPTPGEPCSFLELPPEIRNRIYSFVVVEDEPIYLIQCHRFYNAGPKPPMQPGLAMTCQQIRQEVMPVFYGENTFVYNPNGGVAQYDRGEIKEWVKACEPYLSLIRSVGVAATRNVFRQVSKDEDPENYEIAKAQQKEEDQWFMSDHPLDEDEMAEIERSNNTMPVEDEDDSGTVQVYMPDHYIVTATLRGANDEVEIGLEGDLEDQCVCSLREGGWDGVIDRPRGQYIRYAMQYCRDVLKERMFTFSQPCQTCGDTYGTINDAPWQSNAEGTGLHDP